MSSCGGGGVETRGLTRLGLRAEGVAEALENTSQALDISVETQHAINQVLPNFSSGLVRGFPVVSGGAEEKVPFLQKCETKTFWNLKDGTLIQAMRPVHIAFEHGDAGIAPGAAT